MTSRLRGLSEALGALIAGIALVTLMLAVAYKLGLVFHTGARIVGMQVEKLYVPQMHLEYRNGVGVFSFNASYIIDKVVISYNPPCNGRSYLVIDVGNYTGNVSFAWCPTSEVKVTLIGRDGVTIPYRLDFDSIYGYHAPPKYWIKPSDLSSTATSSQSSIAGSASAAEEVCGILVAYGVYGSLSECLTALSSGRISLAPPIIKIDLPFNVYLAVVRAAYIASATVDSYWRYFNSIGPYKAVNASLGGGVASAVSDEYYAFNMLKSYFRPEYYDIINVTPPHPVVLYSYNGLRRIVDVASIEVRDRKFGVTLNVTLVMDFAPRVAGSTSFYYSCWSLHQEGYACMGQYSPVKPPYTWPIPIGWQAFRSSFYLLWYYLYEFVTPNPCPVPTDEMFLPNASRLVFDGWTPIGVVVWTNTSNAIVAATVGITGLVHHDVGYPYVNLVTIPSTIGFRGIPYPVNQLNISQINLIVIPRDGDRVLVGVPRWVNATLPGVTISLSTLEPGFIGYVNVSGRSANARVPASLPRVGLTVSYAPVKLVTSLYIAVVKKYLKYLDVFGPYSAKLYTWPSGNEITLPSAYAWLQRSYASATYWLYYQSVWAAIRGYVASYYKAKPELSIAGDFAYVPLKLLLSASVKGVSARYSDLALLFAAGLAPTVTSKRVAASTVAGPISVYGSITIPAPSSITYSVCFIDAPRFTSSLGAVYAELTPFTPIAAVAAAKGHVTTVSSGFSTAAWPILHVRAPTIPIGGLPP